MHDVFNNEVLVFREHVGLLKLLNSYDVFTPDGKLALECREPRLGGLSKLLRLVADRSLSPFLVDVHSPEGETLLTAERGVALPLLNPTTRVSSGTGDTLGILKLARFSLAGKLTLLAEDGTELCRVKGKVLKREFTFERDGVMFGRVSKTWAGLGKELFTSADNYVLTIDDRVPPDGQLRPLMVATVLVLDLLLSGK